MDVMMKAIMDATTTFAKAEGSNPESEFAKRLKQIDSIEQLRENYEELISGKLVGGRVTAFSLGFSVGDDILNWLKDMYYEDEYNALNEFVKKGYSYYEELDNALREILQIPPTDEAVEKLKQYTDDPKLLAKARNAVYNQRELAEKLKSGCREILLAGGSFTIPTSVGNVVYICIGNPKVNTPDQEILKDTGISICYPEDEIMKQC